MEDLKKKVEGMSAQNALYTYVGLAALTLLLFFFGNMFGKEGMSVSGKDVLFGLSVMGVKVASFGTAQIFGFVAVFGLIGVTIYAYTQKKFNWQFSLVPVVALLLTAFTCKAKTPDFGFGEEVSESLSAGFMMWLVILLAAAWAGFAYLRSELPAEVEKK